MQVLVPFDEKLKSLTTSMTMIQTAKKLAEELAKQMITLQELKSIMETLDRAKVASSFHLHHSLDLPDDHKSDEQLIKLAKEIDEEARAYETKQTARLIASKKCIYELKKQQQREILLHGGLNICLALTTCTVSTVRTKLQYSTLKVNDFPDDPPISSLAFCTLHGALGVSTMKACIEHFTGIPTAEYLKELTNLVPQIYPTEPILIVVPSMLRCTHWTYEKILMTVSSKLLNFLSKSLLNFRRWMTSALHAWKPSLKTQHVCKGKRNVELLLLPRWPSTMKTTFEPLLPWTSPWKNILMNVEAKNKRQRNASMRQQKQLPKPNLKRKRNQKSKGGCQDQQSNPQQHGKKGNANTHAKQ